MEGACDGKTSGGGPGASGWVIEFGAGDIPAAGCLSAYREHEDLITIGAYRKGSNRTVDLAIEMLEPINEFLRQRVDESSSVEESRNLLLQLRQVCLQKVKATVS